MVSRGKTETAETSAESAAKAAATAATVEEEQESADEARPTAVRFNKQEYEYLKKIFETKGKGLKISTGVKMAA
jgi:hypothetical protein